MLRVTNFLKLSLHDESKYLIVNTGRYPVGVPTPTLIYLRSSSPITMTGYNLSRAVADLLADNDLSPPSFTVNLYPEHWTLNQGSKFLYNNPVAVSGTPSALCALPQSDP